MAAPEHFRVIYSGVFGASATAPVEAFAWSFALAPGNGPSTVAGLQPVAQELEGLWASSQLRGHTGNHSHVTRCRIARIGADGKTLRGVGGGPYAQADYSNATPRAGTATTNRHPLQVALAVSLLSESPGPTGKGRFFLPAPALAIDSDGRISTTDATAVATSAKAFLDAVNAAMAARGIGRVVLASGGSAAQGIPPLLRPIATVGVGRVLDTMRSRREDQREERVSLALA